MNEFKPTIYTNHISADEANRMATESSHELDTLFELVKQEATKGRKEVALPTAPTHKIQQTLVALGYRFEQRDQGKKTFLSWREKNV